MSHRTQHGTLYLIPVPLAAEAWNSVSPRATEILHLLRYFIVENARTARRAIKATNPPYAISELHISELDKHDLNDPAALLAPLFEGEDIGVLSEAGCPGVADPGNFLVRYAHREGVRVVPLTGPSSILLALMASGMEGQRFQFHGYLSPKREELMSDLRMLESVSRRDRATQIFIEVPYRNQQIFETALTSLAPDTLLSIAVDLTSPDEWIRMQSISAWAKKPAPELHKRPAVFCLSAGFS